MQAIGINFKTTDVRNDFKQDALVILAHGSTKNANSAASALQHAESIRSRAAFKEVQVAYWKQPPFIKDVLATVSAPRICIVPLFISAGFFCEEKIPADLGFGSGRILKSASQTLYYAKPIGTHPGISQIILNRAREVVAAHPFPFAPPAAKISLFIAGHGTEQSSESRQSIEAQVQAIRSSNLYAEVHSIYLDEEPRIPNFHKMTKCKNVVVVPFFISEGMHTLEDIPVLLGEPEKAVRERLANNQPPWRNPSEKFGKLVWYSKSVGSHPDVANLIYERAVEALAQ